MDNALKLEAHDRFADMSMTYPDLSISLLKEQGIAMVQRAQHVSDSVVDGLCKDTGVSLPLENCRLLTDGKGVEICSVSPTMWFIQTEKANLTPYLDRLNEAGSSKSIYATDMSDQLACLEVIGKRAVTLFAKGCPLDFRDQSFPIGQSARSLLGQANVIFNHVDTDKFHLLLDVSLFNYLWAWLEETAQEFKA